MRVLVIVLVLALAALVGWSLAPGAKSEFGEPLRVGGVRVPDAEIRLWLVYGPGHERVEARKTRLLCAHASELIGAREASATPRPAWSSSSAEASSTNENFRAASPAVGAPAAQRAAAISRVRERCAVTDAELELEYGRAVDEFLVRNPGRGLEAELGRAHRSSTWFRDELRVQLEFDKLFFPEPPHEWPDETWDALADFLGDDATLTPRERHARVGMGGWQSLRANEPLRLDELRARVRAHLETTCRFRIAPEGLAPGLALTADFDGDDCADASVTIEELWEEVRDSVEPWETVEIRRWLATCHATRQQLESEGARVTEAERTRAAELLRERGTIAFGTSAAGTANARFPWPAMHAEYFVLSEIWRARTARERATQLAAADAPDEHVRRASWKHAGATVNVEVLLVPALDIPRNRWIEGGWSAARARATELLTRIAENERSWLARAAQRGTGRAVEPFVFWNRLLDEESGWWDPPDPRGGVLERAPRNHGRFYERTWGELRTLLGETEYTDWVHGDSLAERVFFELEPGEHVTGPWRCALGWCLVRVGARQPPARLLDAADPRDRLAIDDDEQCAAFAEYTRAARSRVTIEGLPD